MDGNVLIDVQGSPEDGSAIQLVSSGEEEGLSAAASQTDTVVIEVDSHTVLPGGSQTPTFQGNAFGAPVVSPGALPAPNDNHIPQAANNGNAPPGAIGEREVEPLFNQIIESSLLIDVQGSPEDGSAIQPVSSGEEEGLSAAASQTDTVVIEVDSHTVLSGGPQTPTFQGNAFGAPVVSPGALPAPNDNHIPQAANNVNASPGAIGEREVEPLFNQIIESSLLVAPQLSVTLLTAWLNNGNHTLSHNRKILRDVAVVSNVVGYVSSLSKVLMCRRNQGVAARILTIIAFAGAAFGFIASMGMLLPDELNLWITCVVFAICFPALAAGLRRVD